MGQDQPVSVRYEDVSVALTTHLQELREAYETEQQWWSGETPGPHVIYGNVLNPYIERLIEAGDEAALRRVFAFVELLSNSDDVRVQEVVAVTICERLGSDENRLMQAKRLMGPATRKISDEVEAFWNAQPSPL